MFTLGQYYAILNSSNKVNIKTRGYRGMAKVFSLINHKGGVAKSVSTSNIGVELANTYGLKVLMVDLDPQANLTIISGVEPESLDMTISDVLVSYSKKDRVKIEEVIIQLSDNLYLAPSIIDLAATDTILQSVMSREYVLKKALSSVMDLFDVVLIDCPPSLGLLPLNALSSSDFVIIPCATEYLAYRGLKLILDTISGVKENLNENLELYGMLATRHKRTTHSKEILDLLQENYNVLGVIPEQIKVSDAMYSDDGTIVSYDSNSKPAIAYKLVAHDMVKNLDLLYNDIGLISIEKELCKVLLKHFNQNDKLEEDVKKAYSDVVIEHYENLKELFKETL